jgi:sec-independent protein translocase protein TatB
MTEGLVLDFGFAELLVIIAIAVLVIGPSEIPTLMVALGRVVRRLQYIRFAISEQFEDFMNEADMNGLRTSVNFEAEDVDMSHIDEAEADEDVELLPPKKGQQS